MDILFVSILFFSAIIIGIFAVLFGGTLFLSLPLFQILFPEMAFGALVGNIKLGSIVRNLAAIVPLRKHLDTHIWILGAVLAAGSILGATFIAEASLNWIPFALLVGLLISEHSKFLTIPKQLFWVTAFITGIYGGIIGAGIMLLIIALLQLRYQHLVSARANAVALELSVSIVAVLIFIRFDLIDWHIAFIWATGGIIGGYIGGLLINKTDKLSNTKQQWLLRMAFSMALIVSIYSII